MYIADNLSPSSPDGIELEHGGRSFRLHLPNREQDHVQATIAKRGRFYELDMLNHIESVLKPGELAIDVGAYIGNHVVFMAGACDARVLAFEPNPAAFDVLETNVVLNGLEGNVTARRAAVGRATGRASLAEPPNNNLGSASVSLEQGGDVEVLALDDVELPGAPRLIKIDVEGMELDVLAGADETIRQHRPSLYIEVRNNAALGVILDHLRQRGYTATAQFNATPTVLFVPEQDVVAAINAQVAYARHAAHIDGTRHTNRLSKEVTARAESLEHGVQEVKGHVRRIRQFDKELLDRHTELDVLLRRQQEELMALRRGIGEQVEAASKASDQLRAHVDGRIDVLQAELRELAKRPSEWELITRKLRKLRSDPKAFLRDARSPSLRGAYAVLRKLTGRR